MTCRKIFKPQDGYTAEQVRLAYRTWACMKQRCGNPNNTNYHRYGGRGITYDSAWVSFDAFFADMGGRISREHTLDRIDNNGDYTKSNCRWVKQRKQNRNKSQNTIVAFKGRDFRVADLYYENAQVSHLAYTNGVTYKIFATRINEGWTVLKAATREMRSTRKERLGALAYQYDQDYKVLLARLRRGWSLKKALLTPHKYKNSLAQKARDHGMTPSLVKSRIKQGWSLEKALTTPNKHEKSLAVQARERGLSPSAVQARVRRGWSVEKALSTPLDTSKIRSKK